MKKVKDLKVGDSVYMLSECGLDPDMFKVTEVKKKGTLAIVKLSVWDFNGRKEAVAYGHVSSTFLSWYSRNLSFVLTPLTTWREAVQRKVEDNKIFEKEQSIGMLVRRLFKELKQ